MTHRTLLFAAAAVFLGLASPVNAEQVQWNYTGGVTTTGPNKTPYDDPGGPHVLFSAHLLPDGSMGSMNPDLRVEFADTFSAGAGSQSMTAFRMRAYTVAGGFSAGPFSNQLHTFDLKVGLKDAASGASGFLTFKGSLDGFIGGGTSATGIPIPTDLKAAFAGPKSQSLVLGAHKYEVSIDPFTFRYGSEKSGLSPYQNVKMSVQVSEAPEPSTLALAALGGGAIALRAWRRRKSAHLAQPS